MAAGRPSTFKQEYIEKARKLILLNLSDREIIDHFGIGYTQLKRWKKASPEFCEVLARGRVDVDANVAARLYDRAVGMETEDGRVYPPDTQAATWWLKNRRPDKWRDRVEHTGADGGAITINLVKFSEKEPVTIEHEPDKSGTKNP